jgi:hypothetical protein
MSKLSCTNCGVGRSQRQGQWWGLGNYYGINGYFCPDCYEKASHNAYGKPNHPKAYQQMLEKQKKQS